MKYVILILLFVVSIILLVAQEDIDDIDNQPEPVNTQLSMDVDYYYELIKFYLSEEEYDLALTYLDSTMANPTDSLYYFKGKALKGKNIWESAAQNFAQSIIVHRHQGIRDVSKNELKEVLLNLPAMEAISLLSNYMNDANRDDVLTTFLFILAEIYEVNQLYEEANDVYQTILKETKYLEKVPVKLRIATNQIFLKKFQEAIVTLKPVISLNDSIYNEDALFFCYIAHYSIEDFKLFQVLKNFFCHGINHSFILCIRSYKSGFYTYRFDIFFIHCVGIEVSWDYGLSIV